MSHYDGRTDDASHEIRASRVHGMSRRKCFGLHSARNSAKFTRIQRDQGKSARAAAKRRLKNRANLPERVFAQWLKESAEYIKFVNPGDLRVAAETCGAASCHAAEVRAVSTSMMTHSGFLWGAALYNNGGYPVKNPRFGESYNHEGLPQAIKAFPKPTAEETRTKGVIPELDPLYRWEISQPGNVLRVFERGGRKKAEIGNPNREEYPGKPDDKLSDRGFGTELRTDPVFLGLQKT